MNGTEKTVALVAPGFAVSHDIWESTIACLTGQGFGVKAIGQNAQPIGRFAARDDDRARFLTQAFLDPDVDAVLCMRGGSGCSRVLDHLDIPALAHNRKPLIGYSDVTALHMALSQKTETPTIHGPMGIDFLGAAAERRSAVLAETLAGRFATAMTETDGLFIAQTGRFAGPLMGGNLTVFLSLIGTPEFHVPDGCVLFFEDVGEYDFRIDRAFVQLRRSGLLAKAGACLFGQTRLAGSDDPDAFRHIAMEHLACVTGPVVFDFPCAHGRMDMALPLGQICDVEAEAHAVRLDFAPPTAQALKSMAV